MESIDDESFDTVTAMFSVLFFPDRKKGLSEMHRVLRSGGGAAVVSGWAPAKSVQWISLSNTALRDVVGKQQLRELMGIVPVEAVPNFSVWSDMGVLEKELLEAGFDRVETLPVKRRFELASHEAASSMWHDMAKSFPTLSYVLDQISINRDSEIRESVAERFADLVMEQGGYVDGTAHFGVARKD